VTSHLVRFWTWNGIGVARSSKNTLRLMERGAFEHCWFGEVEGLFLAIWSLGNLIRNRSILRTVERKLSSVRGVVVTSENATHLANEYNGDLSPVMYQCFDVGILTVTVGL
jgi:hypothetical protein